MSDDPHSPPSQSATAPNRAVRPAPKNMFEALLRGALGGLKWTTLIIGPLALLQLIVYLAAPAWLRLIGQPESVEIVPSAMTAIVFYLSSCVWGTLLGISIGFVRYLLGWRATQ